MINKKSNEKIPKLFLNGMWKGAIGGFCVYGSKKLIYSFGQHDNYTLAWSSKLLNAAGSSIIENASGNYKFLTTWHFNFGFNRVEFRIADGFHVNYKIMPFALYGFIYSATGAQFSLSRTFQLGQPVFLADSITNSGRSFEVDGFTMVNSITVRNTLKYNNELMAHEIIHCYQYEGFDVFNTYLDKLLQIG